MYDLGALVREFLQLSLFLYCYFFPFRERESERERKRERKKERKRKIVNYNKSYIKDLFKMCEYHKEKMDIHTPHAFLHISR